jgi:hypothetical protein
VSRPGRANLVAAGLIVLLAGAAVWPAHAAVFFGAATNFATGTLPIAVAIADLNGDGKADLVTVNTGASTVSVLLGTGTGGFGPKTDFATGAVPHGLAVADLDGDGHLDVVVANTGENTVSVLRGTGTGALSAATSFPTGTAPFFLAIGDLDGDGIPDLVVVNVNADTVSVLLGVGDGSFGPKTDFATGAGARSVAIGDLNGDGVPDLVVANVSANTVSVLLGTGTGSFGPKTDFPTGAGARDVAVADVNGDGRLDVIVANANADTVSVLLGAGDGTLGPKTDFAVGSGPRSVAIGDVDEDGTLDLVVANFGANTISVLLGTGTGSFAPQTDLATDTGPFTAAIGDLNGNGRRDVVVANVNANTVSVFLNTSAPAIAVTPSFDDFGTVAVGSTADRVFTVTNTGAGTLSGSASTAPPFSIVAGGSYNLAAGAGQNVTVRFQPTAVAIATGNANFTYSGGHVSRGLMGTGTNPVPVLAALSPNNAMAGGTGFTLTATGTNFVASSVVRWNGVNRTTTFVTSTELRAAIPANEVAVGGSAQITVFDPLPGGGTSNALIVTITTFADVPPSYIFWPWVEALVHAGITGGCGTNPPTYCPDQTVTRAQMAVFLLRGIHGAAFTPPAASGLFADVPTSHPLAAWIEQLFAEAITGGCGTNPPRYCPDQRVTRGQTAVFLLRSKHGASYQPPAATGLFADVSPTDPFAPWIEQLFAEGITAGCDTAPLRYCPDLSVTRGQMAVFLVRAFSLPL